MHASSDLLALLQVLTLGVLLVGGALVRKYLPAYVAKKAENLATREDIAEITAATERARLPFTAKAERLRALQTHESNVLTKRQQLFIELAEAAANAFLSGRTTTEQDKARFTAAYSAAFLYAPDHILRLLHVHLDCQMRAAAEGAATLQPELKRSFAELMQALRSEVSSETTATAADFRFFSLG